MRCFFLLAFLIAQTLLVGCGQATYDERLKANVNNPKRMSARNPAAQVEEGEPDQNEEGAAEELDTEVPETGAAADNNT